MTFKKNINNMTFKKNINNMTLKQNIIISSLLWFIIPFLWVIIFNFITHPKFFNINLTIEIGNIKILHEDIILLFFPVVLVLVIQYYVFFKFSNNLLKIKIKNFFISISCYLLVAILFWFMYLMFFLMIFYKNLP